MGNKKQVKTIKERYGKDWWAEQGSKPHKRGIGFGDPEIKAKAIETRKRNRELAKDAEDEIQADTNI